MTRIRMQAVSFTALLMLAATGCQQPAGELFPALLPQRVWPPPPETPRIRLVGAFSGSADLKAARSGQEVLRAALRGPRPELRLFSPHAVAWHPDGILAVADSGGSAVHLLDLNRRTHIRSHTAGEQHLATPVGAAWVGDRLLVCDSGLGRIVELDRHAAGGGSFAGPELQKPVGITYVAGNDRIYVVDGGAHVLRVYDRDGRALQTIGGRGSEPGRFNYPTHIAYDGAKTLAVADSGNFRVQLLDLDGSPLGVVGRQGNAAGDVSLPKGVAFDSEGHLYVVDARFENFQIFDKDGRLLLAVGHEGSDAGEFSLPAGIAIDERDRIWVADSANHRVQVFQYLKAGPRPAATLTGKKP